MNEAERERERERDKNMTNKKLQKKDTVRVKKYTRHAQKELRRNKK